MARKRQLRELTPLAKTIKAARKALKLSQEDLAVKAGVTQSFLNFIETGRTKQPNADDLTKIAKVLELDPIDLKEMTGHFTKEEADAVRAKEADVAQVEESEEETYPNITRGQAAVLDLLWSLFPEDRKEKALAIMKLMIQLTPDDQDRFIDEMDRAVQQYKKAS